MGGAAVEARIVAALGEAKAEENAAKCAAFVVDALGADSLPDALKAAAAAILLDEPQAKLKAALDEFNFSVLRSIVALGGAFDAQSGWYGENAKSLNEAAADAVDEVATDSGDGKNAEALVDVLIAAKMVLGKTEDGDDDGKTVLSALVENIEDLESSPLAAKLARKCVDAGASPTIGFVEDLMIWRGGPSGFATAFETTTTRFPFVRRRRRPPEIFPASNISARHPRGGAGDPAL